VKALLDHRMADVTAADKNGRSLLHLAVQSGNKDVAWLIAEQMTKLQGARMSD
jgi:ankyrin repeat protein